MAKMIFERREKKYLLDDAQYDMGGMQRPEGMEKPSGGFGRPW